ncbi:VWA domain-containing protein [Vibrio splendidus]
MTSFDQNNTRFTISLEKTSSRPDLNQLVEASAISLTKKGLSGHTARVAMAIDLSGSMNPALKRGEVTRLLKQTLAQGLTFDDDGDIEIFVFGSLANYYGTMNLANLDETCEAFKSISTKGLTNYGDAISTITKHYTDIGFDQPVFVQFITDGNVNPEYRANTVKAITKAAELPIFWSFMGIGNSTYLPLNGPSQNEASADKPNKKKGFLGRMFGASESNSPSDKASKEFPFLMQLDTMDGRKVDNASFFSVGYNDDVPATVLIDHMHAEYPDWLAQVRQLGMLP